MIDKQLNSILVRLDTGGYLGWGGTAQAQAEIEILFTDRVIKLLKDIVTGHGCGCLVCDDIKDRLTKLIDLVATDNQSQVEGESHE